MWTDYDVVSTAGYGWEDVLERWDVDVLVLSRRSQSDLIDEIRDDPNWRLVYEDVDGALLVRP